jgi:hypothetical protein
MGNSVSRLAANLSAQLNVKNGCNPVIDPGGRMLSKDLQEIFGDRRDASDARERLSLQLQAKAGI